MKNIKIISENEYLDFELSNKVHPLQSVNWGIIKEPGWKYELFGIFHEQKLIDIFLVLIKKIPALNIKFGYIPRGFGNFEFESLEEVLPVLVSEIKKLKLSHLIVDPDIHPSKFSNFNKENFQNTFIKNNFKSEEIQIQPNRTVFLNLEKTEIDLFSQMRSKHRQYIRKAQKNGFVVEEGSTKNLEDLGKIIDLLSKNKGYVLHDLSYYKKIWDNFSKSQRAKILILKKENKVHGVYLFLLSKDIAYEMYGGCDPEANKLLGTYLLKWESIKFFKNLNYKYYDQWGAEFKYPGLVQFKEGFGGFEVEFPPSYYFIYNKIGYNFFELSKRFKNIISQIR